MLLALIIGAVVGLVLGLTGAGGSLFAVPLLILGLGLGATEATGLALGAVASSALWGILQRLHHKEVVWLPALILATSGALMAPLGRWLAGMVADIWLLIGFAFLVLVVAIRMWRQAQREPEKVRVTRSGRGSSAGNRAHLCQFSTSGRLEFGSRCLGGIVIGGLVSGLLSGLFGVGGGFIIVPLLMLLTGLEMTQAVATSLVVIAIISSAGFASYILLGSPVDLNLLILLAAGGAAGMLLGSTLAHRLAGPKLQKLFVILMLLLTVASLTKMA